MPEMLLRSYSPLVKCVQPDFDRRRSFESGRNGGRCWLSPAGAAQPLGNKVLTYRDELGTSILREAMCSVWCWNWDTASRFDVLQNNKAIAKRRRVDQGLLQLVECRRRTSDIQDLRLLEGRRLRAVIRVLCRYQW